MRRKKNAYGWHSTGQKSATTIDIVHKIGSCEVLRLYKDGAFTYLASYKGEAENACTPRDAIRAVRARYIKKMQRVGEIVAFRAWKLRGEFLVPVAVTKHDPFLETPIATAHEVPSKFNSAGFWAVKERRFAMQTVVQHYNADVWGTVGLYGKVIEHELGYRAEKMVVRKLHVVIPSSQAYRDLLANRYECEVVVGTQPE